MSTYRSRRAVTLIELLTVIAIISVLVAILMPVLGTVRETGRETSCLANMHKIGVAVSQYRDDYNGEYPPMLLGPAEDADGNPVTTGGSPAPAGQMQHGFLYKKYISDISVFHCPDNPTNDTSVVTLAQYSPSGPVVTFETMGMPAPKPTDRVPYYAFDSYDSTALLGASATRQLAYTRDWTGKPISPADDPNQMKYRNAPPEQTVVTWCYFHASVAGAKVCPALLASGTAKSVPADLVSINTWQFATIK